MENKFDEEEDDDLLMSIIESEEDEISLKSINPLEKMDIYQQKYMEDKHWFFKYRLDVLTGLLKRFITKTENLDILDIGIGTGTISKELEKFGNCIHVEKDQEIIKYNNQVNPELKIVKAEVPWDIANIEDKKFDFIIIYNLLEYVEKDKWTLDVLKSKLKPNGKILLSTLTSNSLLGANDKLYGVKRRYSYNALEDLLFQELLKVDFYTFFENPSFTKKISDSTDKMFKEDDIYFNYISKENTITYDYYYNKELKHVLKKKLTTGNQLFMVISIMSQKEKQEYIEALNKKNELNMIDKIIDKIVDKKDKEEEMTKEEIDEHIKEIFKKENQEEPSE